MISRSIGTVRARTEQRLRARFERVRRGGDAGFILLESLIAITLITVIMSAVGAEYVASLAASNRSRLQNVAAQLGESTLEQMRAAVPTSRGTSSDPSTLLTGRTKALVDTEYQALSAYPQVVTALRPTSVTAGATWKATDYEAYDSSSSGSTPVVPTTPTTSTNVGPVRYSVWRYLQCGATANSGSCASTTSTPNNIQAFAVVTWPQAGCPNAVCAFVTSTLFNDDVDPTFDLKQTAPNVPVPKLPASFSTVTGSSCNPNGKAYQITVSVNDPISIPLTVDPNNGVPPFSWSTTNLPTNLSLSNANDTSASIVGTLGGKATASGQPQCSTVSVRDAYDSPSTPRVGYAYVVWTILPALSFTSVANQANLVNDTANLPLAATGGSGSYAFSDPNSTLPGKLSISGSNITGTLSRPSPVPQNFSVALQVTDTSACPACASSKHATASTSFTWAVSYGPLVVTNPGLQTATNNVTLTTAKQVTMSAAGGDGTYSWSASGLPSGLSIDAKSGLISGKPTASNPPSTSHVTVTASDSSAGVPNQSVNFDWQVVSPPSFATPANQSDSKSGTANVALTSVSCPDAPCTFSWTKNVDGLNIDPSSGTISGTVADTASTQNNVTVTITDSAGYPYTSSAFSWTIFAKPSFNTRAVAMQISPTGTVPSVAFANSCPNAPCTVSLSGAPSGLNVAANGTVSGKVTGSAVYTGVTATITDKDNVSDVTNNFVWAVTTTANAAMNNVGITKKANTAPGRFDNESGSTSVAHSFSYDAMTPVASNTSVWPAAPSTPITINGDKYVLPTAGSGNSDNILAQGQAIAYAGSGSTNIGFLIASHDGNASATVTIYYTDGTSTTATLNATDWTTKVAATALKSTANGVTNTPAVYMSEQQVPVSPSKQVAFIGLPTTGSGSNYLHVFGISQPPLAGYFNTAGVASKTTTTAAGLDGGGYSLDYEAITAAGGPTSGATVAKSGISPSYQWPSTAGSGWLDSLAPNAATTVPFTATGSSTLGLLVTAVNGNSASDTITVNYTSGTATTGTISTTDWCGSGGNSAVFTASPRYYKDGSTSSCTTSVNYALVANVDPARTISSIVIPKDAKLRVFAIGYGS